MSPEQKAEYIETKKYEAQARRDIVHDTLRIQKSNCSIRGKIWMIQGRGFTSSDRRRMDKNPDWFPKHANRLDFACLTLRELRDWLRGQGIGGYDY